MCKGTAAAVNETRDAANESARLAAEVAGRQLEVSLARQKRVAFI